jgi:hemoglobin
VEEQDVYAAIGEEGFAHLVAEFYRQVPADDILGSIYPPGDLAGAEQRLRDFLIFRFGGPSRYVEYRGHPRLRMRHAPFPVDEAARDRWMKLMNTALEKAGFAADVKEVLRQYFESTATFMINRQ